MDFLDGLVVMMADRLRSELDRLRWRVGDIDEAERHLYQMGGTRGSLSTRAATAREIYEVGLIEAEKSDHERDVEAISWLLSRGHIIHRPAEFPCTWTVGQERACVDSGKDDYSAILFDKADQFQKAADAYLEARQRLLQAQEELVAKERK